MSVCDEKKPRVIKFRAEPIDETPFLALLEDGNIRRLPLRGQLKALVKGVGVEIKEVPSTEEKTKMAETEVSAAFYLLTS